MRRHADHALRRDVPTPALSEPAPSPPTARVLRRAQDGASEALPGDLRNRFERSLGADLGGVRVHRDGAAAEAATSLGARAFAFGQDVYMGAGQYAPQTPEGAVLIAHEVAHTVQQRGGAGAPQCKLEVSAPGDAVELDADHAADAMVAGEPARVAPVHTSGTAFRRVSDDMRDAADQAEDDTRQDWASRPRVIASVGLVRDRTDAVAAGEQVRRATSALIETRAHAPELVTGEQISTNQRVLASLDAYQGVLATQSSTLGDFQAQTARLDQDFHRVIGQLQTLAAGRGADLGRARDGDQLGGAVIAATGQRESSLQSAFRRHRASSHGSGNADTDYQQAQNWRQTMVTQAQTVARLEHEKGTREIAAQGAASELQRFVLDSQVGREASQIARLRQQASDAKDAITAIGVFVNALTKAGSGTVSGMTVPSDRIGELNDLIGPHEGDQPVPQPIPGEPAPATPTPTALVRTPTIEGAVATIVAIGTYWASHQFDDAIAELNAHVGDLTTDRQRAEMTTKLSAARVGKREYVEASQAYVDAMGQMRNAQTEYRRTTREMGQSLDQESGTGESFTMIAQVLGEADAYLAQADATLRIGEAERAAAEETNASSEQIDGAAIAPENADLRARLGGVTERSHEGTLYYGAELTRHDGEFMYRPTEQRVVLAREDGLGHAEGRAGVNPVVDEGLRQLRAQRARVSDLAERLRGVFHS